MELSRRRLSLFFYVDVFPVSLKHPSRNPARKRIYGFLNRFRSFDGLTFDLASASDRVYEKRNFSPVRVGERDTRETVIAVTPIA